MGTCGLISVVWPDRFVVIQAQKNPLFKLRFKGLQDQKKSKAGGMPSVGSLQGDDGTLPGSELILK